MTKKQSHKALSDKSLGILKGTTMKFVCKLGNIMADRGLNQTELAYLTGLRQATINSIIHNTNYTINKEHTLILMKVLKVKTLMDLYEIVFDNEEEELQHAKDSDYCLLNGLMPEYDRELEERRNALKKANT